MKEDNNIHRKYIPKDICDNEKEELLEECLEKIDFKSIDTNLCTDYELNLLEKAFEKTRIGGQVNPFMIEFNKRLSKIKNRLYKEEGLEKIRYDKELDKNIYYHISIKDVLRTGIDLSKGDTIWTGVYESHYVRISPGYVYIYKSSREGLDFAIDGASETGRIVIKLAIPEEDVFLDADQVRFQEDLWFQDATFEEAMKYFDENPEFKKLIEDYPYRATNKRIDKNQIIGILYDSNIINRL